VVKTANDDLIEEAKKSENIVEDLNKKHKEQVEGKDKDLFEKTEEIAAMKFRNDELSESCNEYQIENERLFEESE
jgi:hypothetical protein